MHEGKKHNVILLTWVHGALFCDPSRDKCIVASSPRPYIRLARSCVLCESFPLLVYSVGSLTGFHLVPGKSQKFIYAVKFVCNVMFSATTNNVGLNVNLRDHFDDRLNREEVRLID